MSFLWISICTWSPLLHPSTCIYRLLLDWKSLPCWQVNSVMSLKWALNQELGRTMKTLQWSKKPLMYWLKATLMNRYAIVYVCVCVCMLSLLYVHNNCSMHVLSIPCMYMYTNNFTLLCSELHLLYVHVGCGGDRECFRPLIWLAERCAAEEECKVRPTVCVFHWLLI